MKTIFSWILVAAVSLAVAPATFADHHKGKGKGYQKSVGKADGKAREARSRGAQEREAAEDAAERGAEKARGRGEAAVDKADKGRGAEMRARRDERKVIMEDAKSAAEPGTPRKGKKPWYRFWESDEPTPESGSESE